MRSGIQSEPRGADVGMALALRDQAAAPALGDRHDYRRRFRARGGQGEIEVLQRPLQREVIAYPAEYRSSGVMTSFVGRDDVVYERDMGPRTAQVAKATTGFEPNSTWHALQ